MMDYGGAALGAAFGALVQAVVEASFKAWMFKSLLKQLKSTLESVTPIIKEIEKLNRDLDRPRHETGKFIRKLEQGEQLVPQMLNSKKLDTSIASFFQVDMVAQHLRDTKETLVKVNEMHSIFKRPDGKENASGFKPFKIIGACSVPDPPQIAPGLDVQLEELKMDLLKKGMQVIVLSAPGGSGKTTLVKKLCKDDKVKGKFQNNIFFVTVSKTPNVKVIVQKIFKHKDCEVPELLTDEDAFNELGRLLNQIQSEPILLVLDDVWSGSESMVQNLKFQLPDYKILVTSRFVFPQFGPGHNLKPLNEEDSMTLFNHSAVLPDGTLYIPDQNLAYQIVRACKGSPLALTVVGRSLCGQPEEVWQIRVKEWTQDATIFYSNTDLLVPLQSSLDALDNKIKECYMDLGSFPEDQRIPVTALIDMWMELYKLVEGRYAIANLNDLSNRNLVNLVVTRNTASHNGCYNDHFVMQHDLLRDLIIHQSMLEPIEKRKRLFIEISGNNFPEWWLEQTLHPVNARLLSISTDETFSSSWYDIKAPLVEVVVLTIQTKKYTLPNFMEMMDKMKVLIVTNNGFFLAELSNFKILGSLSNLKTIRLERVSIPSFDMTAIQMKNLLKISLVLCNVGEVFRNSTFHVSDAFPNLKEMDVDYCNDLDELPDGVCDIVSLNKLSITNCHKLTQLPEGIGKLVNLELLRLASCAELEALPDTIGNLSNLNFLDISECLSFNELPIQIGELCSLKTLSMRGCSACELPASIMNLKKLEVVRCDEETAYNWEQFEALLTNLKVEEVKEDSDLNWLRN
ncbi:probable disease resistance protein At5g66890 [Pistacia vera]|uniref:probable disease resistance protein At5g66890 n=1 Tax=Pistacia vera TaxID=55513 RepID=UPI001262AF14|nr:probable disease resistance protein At5g66890 [Pistacia vera]